LKGREPDSKQFNIPG